MSRSKKMALAVPEGLPAWREAGTWANRKHEIIGWESGLVLDSGPSMIHVWC